MNEKPSLVTEHFEGHQRWTAADRLQHLVGSGVDQVSFARNDTGFALSYPAAPELPAAQPADDA